MLNPSSSYKYYSLESKRLLTWLTRVFFDLESLTGEGSKNYEISLMGPNSHNNKVSILIGMKNKQTDEKGV